MIYEWCGEGKGGAKASLAPNQKPPAVGTRSPCSCSSSLFCRYGDDAQLPAITGYKPVAVVRLQQQREQQAGVSAICGAFHQQSMPPLVSHAHFLNARCVLGRNDISCWWQADSRQPITNIFFISGNAIQAFGNGTDVGVWQPQPPIEPTAVEPSVTRRAKDQTSNALDALTDLGKLDLNGDSLYHVCGTLQVKP